MSEHIPDYYRREWCGKVDPYRIAALYGLTDHALFQALKKILAAGQRGGKDQRQDIVEAIGALNRKLEMMDEDLSADAEKCCCRGSD